MIAWIAIDVIQHEGQRRTPPVGQATFGAMTLQKTSREQPSLQRSNRRVRTVRDEDDVERKTRRPVVTLALEVPLSQEMTRIEAQPCDRGLNGLVVRSCWMESEAPENSAQRNAGRHSVDELIV